MKKEYMTPRMVAVEIAYCSVLCGSGTLTEDPATENAHAPELLDMDEDW